MAGLIVVAVNRMPAAEVEVSADLVRRLLADQHPDLARLPVAFLANGWDNELYRVGNGLVARLPRRALGAEIIKNEQRWLPGLAPRLPLPIPYPERTGVPALGYPYSWSVVPYLPGMPAARPALRPGGGRGRCRRVPRRAARPGPGGRAGQPVPRRPAGRAAGSFAANLAVVTGQASRELTDRDTVLRVWDAALAAPGYGGPPLWLHGDLHPANILVADGQVSGVIDFGDITAGDPANDLSVAWMLLRSAAMTASGRPTGGAAAGSATPCGRGPEGGP